MGDFAYRDRTGRGFSDNGWEIVPEALVPLLREAAAAGKPLLLTENGVADSEDTHQASFLRSHATALDAAIAERIPIHGYFDWSLLDNYEWLDGFGPKFGLFEVDRQTFERRPRPSADVFRQLGASFLNHQE